MGGQRERERERDGGGGTDRQTNRQTQREDGEWGEADKLLQRMLHAYNEPGFEHMIQLNTN